MRESYLIFELFKYDYSLKKQMEKFKLKVGLVITASQAEEIKIKTKKIKIIPAWKWLLTL